MKDNHCICFIRAKQLNTLWCLHLIKDLQTASLKSCSALMCLDMRRSYESFAWMNEFLMECNFLMYNLARLYPAFDLL